MTADPKQPCGGDCGCNREIDAESEQTEAMRRVGVEDAVDRMLEDIQNEWDGIHRRMSSESERW